MGGGIEVLVHDLRYSFRTLARSPGFAIVAVLTLALGIGANTAMFSVVHGVILAPLPYPQANRLVFLWQDLPGVPQVLASYPNFEDWNHSSRSFDSMSALAFHNFDLTSPGRASHLTGMRVSSCFLTTLGIRPLVGRDFTPAEDQTSSPPSVLISERLWRERFDADPRVPGKALVLDGKSFTVIGVLPAGFHFLTDTDVMTALRPNLPVLYRDRSVDAIAVLARLKSGVTMGLAEAEMNAVQQDLDRAYPDANRGVGIVLATLKQQIIGDVKSTVLLLFGAVCLVLLIACSNLANLLLARSSARNREFGVRAALGASRGRIVRQLLTESIVLSLAGGAVGIALGEFALRGLLAALPHQLPRGQDIGLHLPVLLFTVFIAILSGIAFGLVPALQSATPNIQGVLQNASRGSTGTTNVILRRLIVVQLALTVVLMAGAGLLLRSIHNLLQVNPGFTMQHVVSFKVGLSPSLTKSAAGTRVAYQQLLARIRELPGVEATDLTNIVPLSGGDNGGPFWIGTAQPPSLQEAPHALYFWTGPDYLTAMQIPLLQGRFFTPEDQIGSGKVVVIDTVLAHTFFPGRNPVGQTLTVAHWGAARIVGVVGHVRHWGLDDPGTYNPSQIYIPVYQLPDSIVSDFFRNLTIVVRTPLSSADLMPEIRNAIYASAPDQPVYAVQTIGDVVSESMASRNVPILLLGAFAALALLLASVGTYGVVSYSTARRTKEIGVRMALGATRGQIFRLITGHTLRMAGAGLALGGFAAILTVRLLPSFSHLLYGVGQADPVTICGVLAILFFATIAAGYVPARRAMRTNPTESLRCE